MLVTDFDGTLAEVVSDPGQAAILPASAAALERLSARLRRVAVLSSRPTSDLARLVPVRGIDLIGDSGLSDLTSDERRRLDRFNIEAAIRLSEIHGVWLEIKAGATAIHYRHARAGADELLESIRQALNETGLHAQRGRRLIEVIPRDRAKGDALQLLIRRRSPVAVVCIGDDENDRPVFELVSRLDGPHLVVGVASNEAPRDLFASCDLVINGPADVSRFLTMVAEWATGKRS